MSKRRRPGQRVWAGLSGMPGYGYIPLEATPNLSFMCDCGDEGCRDWDLWMEDGGIYYHVPECQMLDINPDDR